MPRKFGEFCTMEIRIEVRCGSTSRQYEKPVITDVYILCFRDSLTVVYARPKKWQRILLAMF